MIRTMKVSKVPRSQIVVKRPTETIYYQWNMRNRLKNRQWVILYIKIVSNHRK